jgi:cellulose synthase/poly-beta-1,6-N-acetylglucosamine synthase-like glycosyltransferase
MTPVMESTVPVIACGGVVRILNGIKLEGSILKDISLPKSGLALFQIVEYLRAFLFGRVGWDAMRATLIISGAFSLFNKAAIIAVGGYNTKCVSEDMEVILKLHRYHIKNKKPYRIKFIPDPICWTEVPENLKMLGRQRRRWHLGGFQCIMDHKDMMFNPKYGHLGLLILPYFFFFEMLGPVIELLGYIIVPLSYLFGLLSFKFFILFLGLAIFFGVFLSTISVFMEDITYRRYTKLSHLLKLFIYGVLENFGYRQINSFWRFQAIIKYLTGRRDWELVKKK